MVGRFENSYRKPGRSYRSSRVRAEVVQSENAIIIESKIPSDPEVAFYCELHRERRIDYSSMKIAGRFNKSIPNQISATNTEVKKEIAKKQPTVRSSHTVKRVPGREELQWENVLRQTEDWQKSLQQAKINQAKQKLADMEARRKAVLG